MTVGRGLTADEVKTFVDRLKELVDKDECRTCHCLQGLLTQLELDAAEDVMQLTEPLKVPSCDMQGCLGCDPCPPAALFAEYIGSFRKP